MACDSSYNRAYVPSQPRLPLWLPRIRHHARPFQRTLNSMMLDAEQANPSQEGNQSCFPLLSLNQQIILRPKCPLCCSLILIFYISNLMFELFFVFWVHIDIAVWLLSRCQWTCLRGRLVSFLPACLQPALPYFPSSFHSPIPAFFLSFASFIFKWTFVI